MNPIIDYFKREVQGKVNEDNLAVLESVIKYAKPEHVLEAAEIVCTFESGAKILEQLYETTPLGEQEIIIHADFIRNWQDANRISKSFHYKVLEHMQTLDRCLEKLNAMTAIRNSEEYMYETTLESLTQELHQMENRVVLEGASLQLTDEQVLETATALTQAQFNIEFTKAFMNPKATDELVVECVNNMMRLSNRYDSILAQSIILEGDKNGNGKLDNHEVVVKKGGKEVDTDVPSKSAGQKAHAAARSASTKVRSTASKVGRSTAGFKKAGGEAKGLIGGAFDKLARLNREERMEAIVQGGFRKKFSTLMRTAILTGAATAINPALGLLTLLTAATTRKYADIRLKEEVVTEYEAELKLVREKIRDAESAGDKKKKYQLMRIENQLERGIERIMSPIRTNRGSVGKIGRK